MNNTLAAIDRLPAGEDLYIQGIGVWGCDHDRLSIDTDDLKALAADHSRDEMRWIPCEDRLPETSEWFLVTVNDEINHDGQCVKAMFFQDCITQWDCNEEITKVLAWMPLPPPYQPEEPG